MIHSYSYSKQVTWGLAASVFLGFRRSFRKDGQACIDHLSPPLCVLGKENIPPAGPCLILFNHYYRPGYNAWWTALAIAAVVPQDIHFTMTGELTFPGKWYAPFGMAGSRWLLKRISRVYGFTTMPPMPPRPKDLKARALSVRAVLAYARSRPRAILALAPEGGDQPGGLLAWPPAGAGRFIALLTGSGMPIHPVGVYEENGRLCVNFGPAYWCSVSADLSVEARDRKISEMAMRSIARRLPGRLQGEFDQVVLETGTEDYTSNQSE